MKQIYDNLIDKLWKLPRSITGNAVRETLNIIKKNYIRDLKIYESPCGKEVFDWKIPHEWNCNGGYIADEKGNFIINSEDTNLHIMGYSVPIDYNTTLDEFVSHLYIGNKEQPDVVPYKTDYYNDRKSKHWGFCLSWNQYQKLLSYPEKHKFKLKIDSRVNRKGSMTWAEATLKGKSDREILFSTYTCHPQMANDNLSGIICCVMLYWHLKDMKDRQYTYRFYFGPETIGCLLFLEKYENHFKRNLAAGFVLTCVGNNESIKYKKSRWGGEIADHIAAYVFGENPYINCPDKDKNLLDWDARGSDERQYNSCGFHLPVGCIMRGIPDQFPEYHTSLDNLDFISFENIHEVFEKIVKMIFVAENDCAWKTLKPYGEPMLSKYGLYDDVYYAHDHYLMLLANGDQMFSLLEFSKEFKIDFFELVKDVKLLEEKGLLERIF